MNKLTKRLSSVIEIRLSFFALCVAMIALGYRGQFFILLASVGLHEGCHILAAARSGLKLKKVTLSGLGLAAAIPGMEKISPWRRLAISLAGPGFNLAVFAALSLFPSSFRFAAEANLALALFNLLPAFPLDGGAVLRLVASLSIGEMNANRLLSRTSKAVALFITLAGFAQIVLYPYNISLLCLGAFLRKAAQREYLAATCHFYRRLTSREGLARAALLPMRRFYAPAELPLDEAAAALSGDYVSEFVCGGVRIRQKELAAHIMEKGLHGRLADVETAG